MPKTRQTDRQIDYLTDRHACIQRDRPTCRQTEKTQVDRQTSRNRDISNQSTSSASHVNNHESIT